MDNRGQEHSFQVNPSLRPPKSGSSITSRELKYSLWYRCCLKKKKSNLRFFCKLLIKKLDVSKCLLCLKGACRVRFHTGAITGFTQSKRISEISLMRECAVSSMLNFTTFSRMFVQISASWITLEVAKSIASVIQRWVLAPLCSKARIRSALSATSNSSSYFTKQL